MKYILLALLSAVSVSPLSAQEVKIYIWDHYISDQVLRIFNERTGHTVKQYLYDDEVARDAILVNEQAGKYDLIVVDNANTLTYTKLGLFAPLYSLTLKNLEHNSKESLASCGRSAVPFAKGTMGIAYRTSISAKKIDSWNDLLLPPPEHRGTAMMLHNDIDTVAIALLAKGLDPFSSDKQELKNAYALLSRQSQYLLTYGHPVAYVTEHGSSSKVTMAAIYAGDLQNLKDFTGQSDWQYIVPKEGTLFFVDCFVAPANKPVLQGTKAFLEFINDPDIAYMNAQEMWFSTTNQSALTKASEEYKNDTEISPNESVLKRSYHYRLLSKEQIILRNRIVSMLSTKE
ncbi:polyamine ABC transporter substrate-binding protein [Psychromonas ossibalaenae]|uniref:polyamine ABC transporter substrate-binding protein n=1 Tax=Psychromonas ossibalaenae TaxID=444922 RepID=UPI0003726C7E|nr:spermidine/putrescine ABC transporter substrate-binding protein [Psychromonas ossibalaenae]